ncbi:MAG: hypothetical protein AB8B96_14535 [Lysobacterales bacterium]
MAETATLLLDDISPPLPVRQSAMTYFQESRFRPAFDESVAVARDNQEIHVAFQRFEVGT